MGTEKNLTTGVLGHIWDTAMGVESSVRGEGSVTFTFFVLQMLLWRLL